MNIQTYKVDEKCVYCVNLDQNLTSSNLNFKTSDTHKKYFWNYTQLIFLITTTKTYEDPCITFSKK